ncbi:hypothetical protein [Nodularia sphaerocarpa]|uniref:hypothetical protein n=1 Tax=Nodularia sphaerocarpa TaxID=137816 RepID=UPI001EFBBD2F|nr:hypothetical protein [Nodularia sphaerocarpa]MDB9374453.1 hypothetical protein [Nodularia sphaerocarpa CS-585]MDB9377270.1 hypothetical protein [Nodularia sphaerocarpa CS-585A2]ULP72566.1 hypothetical protein BDGGKGIB_02210 [Nodularia sphaerocarpa UHCC 0038]
MKHQKLSVLLAMVTCSSIPFVFSVSSAQAAEFVFSGNFSNGYSAQGSFTTKAGTPASFTEASPSPSAAPFPTQFLQSLSLSVFDSTNTLLESGSAVINGISTDNFLRLNYDNSQTPNLPELNVSTQTGVQQLNYYYINNSNTPADEFVGYGNTTYNLFQFNGNTNTATFLGSTTSIQAAAVPESSSLNGLLGLAALVSVREVQKRRKTTSTIKS